MSTVHYRSELASAILQELYFWSHHLKIPSDELSQHYQLFMHPDDYSLLFNAEMDLATIGANYFGPGICLTEEIATGEVLINPSNTFMGSFSCPTLSSLQN